jgi:hypothetical protein
MRGKDEKKTEAPPTTSLVPTTEDIADLTRLFAEGFAEEKTIGVGNPEDGKMPVFFGELLGPAGSVMVQKPGTKADPVTGEVEMNELPVFAFHPLNPVDFLPVKQATYSVIASHQINTACVKFATMAKAKADETGKPHRAQILMRWNGYKRTRMGNQMNDFSFLTRIVPVGVVGKGDAGFKASGTGAPEAAA